MTQTIASPKYRWLILAFAALCLLIGTGIGLSLSTGQRVATGATALVRHHIPALEQIGKLQTEMENRVIELYLYYATTKGEEYRQQDDKLKRSVEEQLEGLESVLKPTMVNEWRKQLAVFDQATVDFDKEMRRTDRDWELLRTHLGAAQSAFSPLSVELAFWRESIRANAFQDGERSLNQVHQLENVMKTIAVVATGLTLFLAFSLYTKLQDRQALFESAYYDTDTGLGNGSLLKDHLEKDLKSGNEGALLKIHFDRYQRLSATQGQNEAENWFRLASDSLNDSLGKLAPESELYRLSAEHWMVRLKGKWESKPLLQLANRLPRVQPHWPGHSISLGGRIGLARYPADGKEVSALLRNVDAALQASGTESTAVQAYEESFSNNNRRWHSLELALRKALSCETQTNNALALHYQAKVNAPDGKLVGAEVLLRWKNDGEWIPPDQFIPIAEQSGLIRPLGKWVLETACQTLARWREQKRPIVPLAVNVSVQQLQWPGFPDQVAEIMKQYQVEPSWLELEMTEAEAARSPEQMAKTMTRLKAMGLRLALDDFGTGYASLSYLRRFPLDILKIDRTFLQHWPQSRDMVELQLTLARKLGLSVVAEGVEDRLQSRALVDLGCNCHQGYFYARPLPIDDFEQRLKAPRPAMV